MNYKKVYKIELPGDNGKREIYNVVGSNVSDALCVLRWSKSFDDYGSEEYKAWGNKVASAISISILLENVID